ncbi:hypothetical protein BK011_06325 [Tenericutes bacterium MZ-XQ]|jgi:hypothetical protein|nr:hypothetical protein BK011_06325 [Tenericutes bacterium MZ-XQ]
MPELIIAAVIVIAISVVFILNNQQNQSIKDKAVGILEKYGTIERKDKRIWFHKNGETYEILFYKILKNHELTINSKYIWEIHRSSGNLLINQNGFLIGEHKKLVIIYPLESKIKRFINENEMVFIDEHDEFYNMRLIRFVQLESFLEEEVI